MDKKKKLYSAPRWHDYGGETVVGHINVTKEERIKSAKDFLNSLYKRKIINDEDYNKIWQEKLKEIEKEYK